MVFVVDITELLNSNKTKIVLENYFSGEKTSHCGSGSIAVGSVEGGVSSVVTHFCFQAVWTAFNAETFPVADGGWGGSAGPVKALGGEDS